MPSGVSTPFDELVAIIPAAGKGSRYGIPKAQAVIEGITFLDLVTATIISAGIDRIIAVTGIETADMLASIRHGITRAKETAMGEFPIRGFLIFPVDHPLVRPQTVIALCSCFRANPEAVVIPRYEQRNGHPVIIPASIDLDLPASHGLSQIIRESDVITIHLDTDDANVIRNLNSPAD